MTKKLQLSQLDANNLQELDGWKVKMETIVEENPFIEVVDRETYEVAKKRRTALKSGRTEIQNQDKEIGSFMAAFRRKTKEIAQSIIDIVHPHETKQQESIDVWEKKLEEERMAKEKEDEIRVNKIKEQIDSFTMMLKNFIDDMDVEHIDATKQEFAKLVEENKFDYMEFDILLEDRVKEIRDRMNQTAEQLIQQENQRLEYLKKDQENEMLRRISESEQLIQMSNPGNHEKLMSQIERIFEKEYDFGDFQEKVNESYRLSIEKAKERIKWIQDNEVNEEKNRIIGVREGLLDKIHQMNIDDHVEVTLEIKKALEQPISSLLAKDEFDKMVERVNESLKQKLEMIAVQIQEKERQEKNHAEFIEKRTKDRFELLKSIEKDRDVEVPMIQELDEDDWNVYFESLKKEVNESKSRLERQERLFEDKNTMTVKLTEISRDFNDSIKLEHPETKNLWLKIDSDLHELLKNSIELINEL